MTRIRALRVGGVYILPYKYRGVYAEEKHYAVVVPRVKVAYTSYDCQEVVDELVEVLRRMGVAEVVDSLVVYGVDSVVFYHVVEG